ncbi:microtubule associated protein (MAP65/ASE1 family) domain-containing protein [Hirsutella rhossiliensis]|uniref:Microtubule associated protein (MAP65/ASE1 family) domain-containing protein n=1 Tax=Hirsutella rhossiliensis TaxID=111463 RepID=A0A9P8MVN4_9HYPO|nr:microtubule associated protein (MAP65/ASE1 family) domain-containing protein [Hirsutella rhossiliensis]KAH0960012.1 microtubule associated protein (MAP65/ASE1 family) domain-containing protein [Hirsutella rhossiliensis]
MDNNSHLAQQVNSSIAQLHGLLDEIGVPSHEREARESELFAALSEALESQVRLVTAEKRGMVDEAKKCISTIRQMEASLDGSKQSRRSYDDDDELHITYPLTRCLQLLREKHIQISRLHKERFEQVKKLVEALESYSSHLEPTFVQIALPPTGPNQSAPPNFDLSPAYVDRLDAEFTRVYDEYTRRLASVQTLSDHIIQLWAELGVPQAQQDGAIVKYYRDAPEQLGLHQEDINRLQAKRDRLAEEKRSREKRLRDLRTAVESLWAKLDVDEGETKAFLNQNRGCGVRQINEFEDELARLNELKRQNLHLFVEDARVKLQDLWDALYFSEDEMLEFTPAFSDVYSDALLEAHEREVARLESLREQRAPMLGLVDKHKTLIHDRDELAASSQDASRLMMRGQKGEKRDPGKLLREEKMRKRIAKELPKVTVDVRKALAKWEDEYGRPFLVFGERYLDELDADEARKPAPTTRSKTPAGPPPSTAKAAPKSGGLNRANSTKSVPPRTMTRTPTASGPPPSKGQAQCQGQGQSHDPPAKGANPQGSPSRIPARVPLSSLKHGGNSPERPRPESRTETLRNGAPLRAPPPKMRDLGSVPELEAPVQSYKSAGMGGGIVRQVEPEDVYDDGARARSRTDSNLSHQRQRSHHDEEVQYDDRRYATFRGHPGYAPAPPPRHVSNTSSNTSTAISGSENWETYDDNSEPEPDACEAYYAKVRAAAHGKRYEPETGPGLSSQAKRSRGIPPPAGYNGPVMIDQDGNRIVSGSEWTDEDAF